MPIEIIPLHQALKELEPAWSSATKGFVIRKTIIDVKQFYVVSNHLIADSIVWKEFWSQSTGTIFPTHKSAQKILNSINVFSQPSTNKTYADTLPKSPKPRKPKPINKFQIIFKTHHI